MILISIPLSYHPIIAAKLSLSEDLSTIAAAVHEKPALEKISISKRGFASKVVVAPKVGFLPQKSFRSVIPFADHDLPAAISEYLTVPVVIYRRRWRGGFTRTALC